MIGTVIEIATGTVIAGTGKAADKTTETETGIGTVIVGTGKVAETGMTTRETGIGTGIGTGDLFARFLKNTDVGMTGIEIETVEGEEEEERGKKENLDHRKMIIQTKTVKGTTRRFKLVGFLKIYLKKKLRMTSVNSVKFNK